MASVRLTELLYPKDHPYHWPVIGYMDDLTAASESDVVDFFKKYYVPGNASMVIAGDIDPVDVRKKVEYWFSDVKAGPKVEPLTVPPAALTTVIKETLTDRVELPRLYLAWLTPPLLQPGDAALDMVSGVLSRGKTSRLYKRLVYDLELAQDVSAEQNSSQYGSIYTIVVTARPSADPPATTLARIKRIVDEELDKLRAAPPDQREVERVRNGIEASFFDRMETVADKADQLNAYFTLTGNPDYFSADIGRYRALTAKDVQAAVTTWLPADRRLELSVIPAAK
jgi:zinc protease